jgi:OmcA/MtrC family decaheme c-type cytochrome
MQHRASTVAALIAIHAAALALAGCSSAKAPATTAGSGVAKGSAGNFYYINLFTPPVGGVITSDVGSITCGASSVAVDKTQTPPQYVFTPYLAGEVTGVTVAASACGGPNRQTQILWTQQTVTLKAFPGPGNDFISWAGDCSGAGDCILTPGADKTVVAIFGKPGSGHPNFLDPGVHGPAYAAYVVGADGALDCATCHGARLTGQGIAPSCGSCHPNPGPRGTTSIPAAAKSGLSATLVSITPANSPAQTVLKFTLKDDAGKNVDVTGVGASGGSAPNMPMAITLAVVNFSGGQAGGDCTPYRSGTGGSPTTVSAYSTIANPVTSGTHPAPGSFTFPEGTLTQVQPDATTKACSAASPCACTAALPCQYAGTAGVQAGRACTTVSPCTCTSAIPCGPALPATDGPGNLTFDAGTGAYTYTFVASPYPAPGSPLLTDPSNTHTLWIAASRQESLASATAAATFTAVNLNYDFDPNNAGPKNARREVVTSAACDRCHDAFRFGGDLSRAFHGGAYVKGTICNVCHYADRANGMDSKVLVHRIHHGSRSYPQDLANCTACHDPAAGSPNRWWRVVNGVVCTSCHDTTSFVSPPPAGMTAHSGGPTNGPTDCRLCHVEGSGAYPVRREHQPFVPIALDSIPMGGTNPDANGGCIPASGAWPAGVPRITYSVQGVALNANRNPVITFKLLRDGADVNFGAYNAATNPEIITGPSAASPEFRGSPSVQFAWAVPQDGIAVPVDFNASASAWIKGVWSGAVAGATLSGPDAANANFYTLTLGGITVPMDATLFQGGVGYSYSLTTTQPLTYFGPSLWNALPPALRGLCWKYSYINNMQVNGLVQPVPNKWVVATGFPARRAIVDNAMCNACHAQLGASPTFHVGQRNDAPSCSWCHTPNRTSSGWSANASTFIHGIHGSAKRSVGFTWRAACQAGSIWNAIAQQCESAGVATEPTTWYPEVGYPGRLRDCEQCHVSGSYDWSSAASAAQLPNLLWTTVGAGIHASGMATSPYVTTGQDYGGGFQYDTATGVAAEAAATTLVSSPISAACFSCHDTPAAKAHMEAGGGRLYQPRGAGFDAKATVNQEVCLGCHGTGRIWAIDTVH